MLPGLVMPPGLVAPVDQPTIELVGYNISGSQTISAPSGIQAGDLLVLLDFASQMGTGQLPASVVPSGFTSISNITGGTGNNARIIASYKIATGSETTITGMQGTNNNRKLILAFRAPNTISGVTVGGVVSEITGGDPSQKTILASNGSTPLLILGFYYGAVTDSILSSVFEPKEDGIVTQFSGRVAIRWKYHHWGRAPNVDIDMGAVGGVAALIGCYLELS